MFNKFKNENKDLKELKNLKEINIDALIPKYKLNKNQLNILDNNKDRGQVPKGKIRGNMPYYPLEQAEKIIDKYEDNIQIII